MQRVILLDEATSLLISEPNPPGDLTALENITGAGMLVHSSDHKWGIRTLVAPSSGMSISNAGGISGNPTFTFTGELSNLLQLPTGTAGLMTRNGGGVWSAVTLLGTPNQITVANGGGTGGTGVTFSLPQDIGTSSSPTFSGLTLAGLTGATGVAVLSPTGEVVKGTPKTDYLPALPTGVTQMLKGDNLGGLAAAVPKTDYMPALPTGTTSMLRSDNLGGLTAATPKTDYMPALPTGVTQMLKGDNLGGLTAAVPGTDFMSPTGAPSNVVPTGATAGSGVQYLLMAGASGSPQPVNMTGVVSFDPSTDLVHLPDLALANAALTNGSLSGVTLGVARTTFSKFPWTNSTVTAFGATTSGNVKLCTLPAMTVLIRAYLVVTGQASGVTTFTGSVGRVSTTYIDYVKASSLMAASGTAYGAASADRGTNATGYDLVTSATDVYLQFLGSGNLSNISGSSGFVILETSVLQ